MPWHSSNNHYFIEYKTILSLILPIVTYSEQHMGIYKRTASGYQIKHKETTRKKSVQNGNPIINTGSMWISIVILPIIIFIPVWRQVLRVSKLRQNWRYALNLPLICRILDVRFLSTIWNQSKLQISLKLGVVQGLDEKTAWCLSAKSCFRERPCERPYMKRFLFFDTNVTARNPSVVPRFRDYGRAGRY